MKSIMPILFFLLGITFLCCCLMIILGVVIFGFYENAKLLPTITDYPFFYPYDKTPTPFEITRQSSNQIPVGMVDVLDQTNIKGYDFSDLACKFKNICNIAPTLHPPAGTIPIGTSQNFWVNNEDTNSYFQVSATLRYQTDHVYFWVDDNISYSVGDIRDLVETFEEEIYPTNREFFGSEWTPGIDGDPHIYILYTNGLGANVAGYFYSPDEYNPLVRKYSNAHEMFYIDASQSLDANYTYGALAHEFQHMIHWFQDKNETSFLNEGFSELATFINGYDTGGFDWFYLNNPDVNLTDWEGSTGDNSSHYGASFLFVTYMFNRFGEDITKAVVHNQLNGLKGIDDVLSSNNIMDPLTGENITATDLFLDWTITNIVQDGTVGDGRYIYNNYSTAPQAFETEIISNCPVNNITRTVNQFGVDYIGITCPGSYTLKFEGATSNRLIPADPHSGTFAYWSNKGDESDMTLTRSFNLKGVTGIISMNYWTWFDIEQDYDYMYVEASTDGQEWQILNTASGTITDPNGASFGWAYTGQSNGWIHETVDLSPFTGQEIFVRFEYITDPAVNGEGFLLDDISIPILGYETSFETEDDTWLTDGFARIENSIPQTFRIALISNGMDGDITVNILPISSDETTEIPITIGQDGVRDIVLIVTGTTFFTRQVAPYQVTIE